MDQEQVVEPMKFYRYNQFNHDFGTTVSLEIWYLDKETKCGYWIKDRYGYDKRFVLKKSKRRYAYPTKEEAFTNFIKRKERQIKILNGQLFRAKEALKSAATLKEKGL